MRPSSWLRDFYTSIPKSAPTPKVLTGLLIGCVASGVLPFWWSGLDGLMLGGVFFSIFLLVGCVRAWMFAALGFMGLRAVRGQKMQREDEVIRGQEPDSSQAFPPGAWIMAPTGFALGVVVGAVLGFWGDGWFSTVIIFGLYGAFIGALLAIGVKRRVFPMPFI